jgi:hypothetical protein
MPINCSVLLVRELASGIIITIVVAAAVTIVIAVVDIVVADWLHRLGWGVTIIGASTSLKQFAVLRG